MRIFGNFQILLIPVLVLVITGCTLQTTMPDSPVPSPTQEPPVPVSEWQNVNHLVQGICFESALDAAGQQFTLRGVADLIEFYELADNSRLCRRPVTRQPFDFSDGKVVAGLWSVGRGCTADHEVIAFNRDDQARAITISARFSVAGDCNYELVRPFWISVNDAADYTLEIQIE